MPRVRSSSWPTAEAASATSQAAEGRHEQIERLVYLRLPPGRWRERPRAAPLDSDSLVRPNLDFDPEGHWDMLRSEVFERALYADCPPEDVASATCYSRTEPALPSRTPISTSDERYGTIPRTYILNCLED